MEDLLRKIASIPCVPYLYHNSRDFIRKVLGNANITGLEVREDKYALYARIKRGKSKHRMIIITHLDHPGIVLRNSSKGIPFGSVGYERIQHILTEKDIPVLIYAPSGIFQQKGRVQRLTIHRNSPVLTVKANNPVATNSQALWDVPAFELQDGIIKMYNADNGAVTAVALQVMFHSEYINDLDAEFIFVYVEEVHQISSTGIAARGSTPFGIIGDDSYIINLEAMEADTSPAEDNIVEALSLEKPNYDSGFLVKVNDGQITYGYQYQERDNMAELLVKAAAMQLGVLHQHTVTAGSTDAKSFSLFPLSPNIVTLAAPCKWKHNNGPNGEFIPEEVYMRDLINIRDTILAILEGNVETENKDILPLSRELKRRKYGLSFQDAKTLRQYRLRLVYAAEPRLKKGLYFETNLQEFIEFNYRRFSSKFIKD